MRPATIAFAIALTVASICCGPADTGSRVAPPPGSFVVRKLITVIPPPGVKAHEIVWIRETVEEHLLLLDAAGIPIRTPFRLQVHRTLRDWQDAYQLVRNPQVSNDPIIYQPRLVMLPPLSQQLFVGPVGPAFLHGVNGSLTLHVVAGVFFEGPSLAYHFLHVNIPALGIPSHVYGEPLWSKVNLAGWRLSNRLALQR